MLPIPIHNILNFLNTVNKNKGVKKSNARVGLDETRAFPLKIGGSPAKRAGSEGGAEIPFPPTPFPSRPARAVRFCARQGASVRSKKVRASFSNCDQTQNPLASGFWVWLEKSAGKINL